MYALIVPFAAMGIAQISVDIGRGGDREDMALYVSGVVAFMLLAPALLVVARRWWVERFDARGVTLRNGRFFPWEEFVRAEPRKRGRGMINNYDLVFRSGTAGVYHLMAENRGELMQLVDALMAGRNPYR